MFRHSVCLILTLRHATPELLLDTSDFALETSRLATAEVELRGAGYAIAVLRDLLDAALHQLKHFVKLAFHDRTHCVQFVRQAAAVDQVDTLGDVRTNALAFSE